MSVKNSEETGVTYIFMITTICLKRCLQISCLLSCVSRLRINYDTLLKMFHKDDRNVFNNHTEECIFGKSISKRLSEILEINYVSLSN